MGSWVAVSGMRNHGAAATILLLLILATAPGWAGQKEVTEWDVDYMIGTQPIETGTELTFVYDAARPGVAVWLGEQRVWSIRAKEIVGLTFGEEFDVEKLPTSGGPVPLGLPVHSPESSVDAAGQLVLAPFVLYSIIRDIHQDVENSKLRCVRVVWVRDGATHEAFLRAPEKTALSLIEHLSSISGKPWINLPEERQRLFERLETEGGPSTIGLEDETWLGDKKLKPGAYSIALLVRPDGIGEVYVYEGQRVDYGKPTAIVMARLEENASANGGPGLVFKETPSGRAVAELRLWGHRIMLPVGGPWILPRTSGVLPTQRFRLSTGWATEVKYLSRRGQPTFRFPVGRLGFSVSEGYLYVSRTRIVYDPAFTPKHRDGFQVERSKVEEVDLVPSDGLNERVEHKLRIVVSGKKHTFRTLFEKGGVRSLGVQPEVNFPVVRLHREDLPVENAVWKLLIEAMTDFDAAERAFQASVSDNEPAPPQGMSEERPEDLG